MRSPPSEPWTDLNAQSRALREHEPQRALELATEALALAREAHDPAGQLAALINLSHTNVWLSRFSLALSQALTALRQAETLQIAVDWADLYLALGRAQVNLANLAEALLWLQQAQQAAQQHGQTTLEADAANVLGIAYYRLEQYEQAGAAYQQAQALYEAEGNRHSLCKVLINQAEACSKQAQHGEALALAEQAHALALELHARFWEAYTLHTLGQIYANQGNDAAAIVPLQASLQVAREVNSPYINLVSTIALGQVYSHQAQPTAAISAFKEGLALAEIMNHTLYRYRCHAALAEIYELQAEWKQALSHYKQFHRLKEQVFNEQNMARIQNLEVRQQIAQIRQEAALYQQRNVALEAEIVRRTALERELQQQATTDPLTGIANRRHFIAQAKAAIALAQRHERPLSLAMIDIDHFKQINDLCGHAIGDQALLALTQTFQTQIRANDILARFGGDEFVLLLAETGEEQAVSLLERVRQHLREQPISAEGVTLTITFSVGVTAIRQIGDTLDYLLARADAGLYEAKRAGRDCVVVAEG